jgi:hypothetical protein
VIQVVTGEAITGVAGPDLNTQLTDFTPSGTVKSVNTVPVSDIMVCGQEGARHKTFVWEKQSAEKRSAGIIINCFILQFLN